MVMSEQDGRPLPRTQQHMAQMIESGQVAYNPNRARWYLAPDAAVDVHAGGGQGRALREMRAAGLLVVREDGKPDGRGALPVELTEAGRARYRPPR